MGTAMTMLGRARAAVQAIFSRHPLAANCLTYGALYTGSELLQQSILRGGGGGGRAGYDWPILGRFAVMGTAVFPPAMFYWYKFLDARFAGVGAGLVARKVLLDQLVFTPPVIATFFIGMSVLEGKRDVTKEFREKAIPTFMA